MLQNDFFKQQYKSFNATIPGQGRIYPNTHLCRTFLLGIHVCNGVGPQVLPTLKKEWSLNTGNCLGEAW